MKKRMLVALAVLIIMISSCLTAYAEQLFVDCPYENCSVRAAGVVGKSVVIAYHYDNNGCEGVFLVDDSGHFLDLFTGSNVFLYESGIQVKLKWTNAIIHTNQKGFSVSQYTASDY